MVWIDNADKELSQLRARNLTILRSYKLCIICAKVEETTVVVEELALTTRIDGHYVHKIASGHIF